MHGTDKAPGALYGMDPNLIMDHLAQADVHVAKGTNHIKRQRQIVEELARHGHNITESTYPGEGI